MLPVQQLETGSREHTKTMKYGMTGTQPGNTAPGPVVNARLGRLLGAVFLLFALLVVNSVYLGAITLLEQAGDTIYQDYFYLLMFLLHLLLGLLLVVPLLLFAVAHMRRAWRRPNRYAVRAGMALFTGALLLLGSGLLLTRFGFLEVNDPLIRQISYWVHIISPLAVAWLFVLHRLAGPPIRWRSGARWALGAAALAAVMVGVQTGIRTTAVPEQVTTFLPSLAVLAGTDTIPASHLMTDATCAECHEDIARNHAHSMHRLSSFNNPAYRFSVEETRKVVLERDGTVQASRFCAGCHDPVPLFSGRFDDPAFDTEHDPMGQAGITCITCHAISGLNGVYGNANYILSDPPRYPFAFSESALLSGINRQLIRAKPAFHKKTLLKPLHRSAEFCSTCHKTHIPKTVNHYRWLRGQNHYDSFLSSGVSGHRVDSFYYPEQAVARCSACHMPLAASDDPAARDFGDTGQRSIHDHQFAAANTGITHLLDLPEAVMEAQQKRLRDVTRIDIFGIKEDGRIDGELTAPLRPAVPVLKPGRRYLVEVVIRTTGIGHHLTQGTTDSNELWLDITATGNGRVIGHSGSQDAEGRVDPWSYFVNSYVLDSQGNRIDRRNGQDIFVALYNHQIPPGAAAVVHYLLDVPDDIDGAVQIEASLKYRKFDTTYLQHMQGDAFTVNDLPITVMATDRVALPVAGSADAIPVQPVTIPVTERWNDYGIALLREGNAGSSRGELRQAEQAFRQVEALHDANGALNLARVYFKEGRLDEAAAALSRASGSEPPAAPWTIAWYSALIDRENGHLEEAGKALEAIIDNRFQEARQRGFDFSRDIRVVNALGRVQFEQARQLRGAHLQGERRKLLEESRDRFLQTLEIEPEDLAAHHNLAQVYRELGAPEQAARHRERFNTYRPDDHAVERAVAKHRSENPAADHAAAAIAIYDLNRKDAARQPARAQSDRAPVPAPFTRASHTIDAGIQHQ
jgi:tetratricopeptide (TPR) repeat protein